MIDTSASLYADTGGPDTTELSRVVARGLVERSGGDVTELGGPRRGLLGTIAAAAGALLAARTGRGRDERLATEDREVTAPSGQFTAIVVADGEDLFPTLRDADEQVVWTDDLPHVDRYFPGVVWESGADVLWVLSTDHGNASVRKDAEGSWEKTMGSDGMPEEISELSR